MNEPLRTCIDCGLEAHTEEDLSLFSTNKQAKHGKKNLCNECKAKRTKQWKQNNPERQKVYEKKWRENNLEHRRAARKKWQQNNRDKVSAYTAKRRAVKLNATPKWYVKEKKRIEFLYATAQLNGLHVDHTVPLQNDMVCGLHTLVNLQLLTPEQNISKNNNFEV